MSPGVKVLLTVLGGIAVYAGAIWKMIHDAMDYDPAWDEPLRIEPLENEEAEEDEREL